MKIKSIFLVLLFPIIVIGQSFKVYDEITIPELNKKYQIGREYPEGYEIFVFNHSGNLYKIKEGLDKTDKSNISPSYIIVRTLDENNKVLKDIVIKDNDIDSEYISFSEKYIGIRKFIIIKSRFSFTIFNLASNKLIVPNYSAKRPNVDLEDAQGLNVGSIKIFDNGQYILCNIGDFGIFCFNLLDMYNPILVEAFYTHPPFSSPHYFFLDHRKDNIYNGICVDNHFRKITKTDYLFKGFRFQQNEQDSIINNKIDNQYVLLKQIDKEDEVVNLIIDYKNGEILDNVVDKELIKSIIKGQID